MDIDVKIGDDILVRHYSNRSAVKSKIVKIDNNLISIKVEKTAKAWDYLINDPVVIMILNNSIFFSISCNIIAIKVKEELIEVLVDDIRSNDDRRQEERYPVSLYADIKERDTKKKYFATIKNISF